MWANSGHLYTCTKFFVPCMTLCMWQAYYSLNTIYVVTYMAAAVRGWIEEEEEKETELDKTEYSSLTQSRPELAVPSAVPVPPAITRTQPEKSLHTKKQASEKTAVAVTENSKTSVCEEAGQITQQESQDATESGATRTQPQSERGGQRSKSGLGGQRSKSGVGDQGSRSGEGVGVGSEVTPGLQLTLEKLMSSLARKRSGAGRPDALQVRTTGTYMCIHIYMYILAVL